MANSSPDEKPGETEVEPLLPIEKKLIGWSLGLGIGLLALLLLINKLYPLAQ